MSIADIKKNTETKMAQSITALNGHLGKIRTGRANPALLDTVMVDYYGNPTPINQVANVSLLDARTISVQPWEKGMGAKIEKAIRVGGLYHNKASKIKALSKTVLKEFNSSLDLGTKMTA